MSKPNGNINDVTHNLISLLSSPDRDFLIRNNGDQVKISDLRGKIVGLYFSGSWCGPCRRFTPTFAELYQEIVESKEAVFEVVFVSSDRNDMSFGGYFSSMPWLAVPFFASDARNRLIEIFDVRSVPSLVIIDANGKISTDQGTRFVQEYGVDCYPFTLEKINFLKEEESEAKKNQSLGSVLVSGSRDFLVSNNEKEILVSELEGKTIGLYFTTNSRLSCVEFTHTLIEIYKKLRERGEDFEVVLVSLDHHQDSEDNFKQGLKTMPWLALPFKDKRCRKLTRYFDLKALPTVAIIGRDGKTLSLNVTELIEDYGIEAYPFTPEKILELREIEKMIQEEQTLESLLVSGERDFVISKNGSKVPISNLVGKNVILYFSAHWCPPCHAFLPKLIEAYRIIKSKDDTPSSPFEVIFVSSDRDKSTFDKFFSCMPWLALPFGDERKRVLDRRFKIQGIPSAVAIGPTGRTVNMEARRAIMAHGAEAYPFSEEHLKRLEENK